VQAAACLDRVDQGLQLRRRRGALSTMPATSAATRSRGKDRLGPCEVPAATTAPARRLAAP
jgi:hypothetical protein